jgi:nucleotide-binding universal stress UspA family protein
MLRINDILIPMERGPLGAGAFSHALALARRFGSRIHVLHIIRPRHPHAGGDWVDPHPTGAGFGVAHLELPVETGDIQIIQMEVVTTSVAEEIVNYTREEPIDLIVMHARGSRGLIRQRFGGAVIRSADCSVLTVREPLSDSALRRLLVPVDLSSASRMNLAVAKELADRFGAEIDLLMVFDEVSFPGSFPLAPSIGLEDEMLRQRTVRLHEFWDTVDGPAVPYEAHLRAGAAGTEIVRFALQTDPDLIVIGTHGRSGLRRLVLGSVAEHVVNHAGSATLVVKTFGRPLLAEPEEAALAVEIPHVN